MAFSMSIPFRREVLFFALLWCCPLFAQDLDADVIVVGLGPVGVFFSLLLSSHSKSTVKILGFDKYAEAPFWSPRAVVWDEPLLRAARSAGGLELDSWMRWHASVMDALQMHNGGLSMISSGVVGQRPFQYPDDPVPLPLILERRDRTMQRLSAQYAYFHQPSWETLIRRHLKERNNVTLHFQSTAVGVVELNGGGCEVEVLHNHSGTPVTKKYRAKYCVGSDGFRSSLAQMLGVPYEGRKFEDLYLTIDSEIHDVDYVKEAWISELISPVVLATPIPTVTVRMPAFFETWWENATASVVAQTKAAPGSFEFEELRHAELRRMIDSHVNSLPPNKPIPPPGYGHRIEVLLPPDVSKEEGLTDDYIKWLYGHFNIDLSRITIVRKVVYTAKVMQAASYHPSPSTFLAGDAAHVTPPFKGQGLCMGMQDASNLAWKLAWVVQGRASPSILRTYETERKPIVQRISFESVMLGVLGVRSPLLAQLRDWFIWGSSALLNLATTFIGFHGRSWLARYGLGNFVDIAMNTHNQNLKSGQAAVLSRTRSSVTGQYAPLPRIRLCDGRSVGPDGVEWGPGSPGATEASPNFGGVKGTVFLDALVHPNGFTLLYVAPAGDERQAVLRASAEDLAWFAGEDVWFSSVMLFDEAGEGEQRCKARSGVVEVENAGGEGAEGSEARLVGRQGVDVEGFFTAWATDYSLADKVLVVRPDKYVVGVFESIAEARAELLWALWHAGEDVPEWQVVEGQECSAPETNFCDSAECLAAERATR